MATRPRNSSDKKNLRTCRNGHQYYKSSDCPVCPICEANKQPEEELLCSVAAPARRALENAGIKTPAQLATYTVDEVLKFHGMGPSSIPKLRTVLKSNGLTFKGG
jgi:hypothetical protein